MNTRDTWKLIWVARHDCKTCNGDGTDPFDGAQCPCAYAIDPMGHPVIEPLPLDMKPKSKEQEQ